MRIITPRRYVEGTTYWQRSFVWREHRSAGFGFACAEDGTPEPPEHEAAAENLRKCLSGEYDVIDEGPIACQSSNYWVPAVGRCDCGRAVELEGFTNTCDCGADYNSGGQRLAPRSCWGEETGETAADILGGGDPFEGGDW